MLLTNSSYRPSYLTNTHIQLIGLYYNRHFKCVACQSLSTCAVVPGVSQIINGIGYENWLFNQVISRVKLDDVWPLGKSEPQRWFTKQVLPFPHGPIITVFIVLLDLNFQDGVGILCLKYNIGCLFCEEHESELVLVLLFSSYSFTLNYFHFLGTIISSTNSYLFSLIALQAIFNSS